MLSHWFLMNWEWKQDEMKSAGQMDRDFHPVVREILSTNSVIWAKFIYHWSLLKKNFLAPLITEGPRMDRQNHCEDASKKLFKKLFWVTDSLVYEVADWIARFTRDNEKPLASRCVYRLYPSINRLVSVSICLLVHLSVLFTTLDFKFWSMQRAM